MINCVVKSDTKVVFEIFNIKMIFWNKENAIIASTYDVVKSLNDDGLNENLNLK